jgi:UDP-N-acetylglucosamine acyltransferase
MFILARKSPKMLSLSLYAIHNNVVIGDGTWIGSNVTIMEGANWKELRIFLVQLFSAVPQIWWRRVFGYNW